MSFTLTLTDPHPSATVILTQLLAPAKIKTEVRRMLPGFYYIYKGAVCVFVGFFYVLISNSPNDIYLLPSSVCTCESGSVILSVNLVSPRSRFERCGNTCATPTQKPTTNLPFWVSLVEQTRVEMVKLSLELTERPPPPPDTLLELRLSGPTL